MVLSNADYREAREPRAEGLSLREIGRRVGCSRQEIWRNVREARPVAPDGITWD